jgi:predicted dehydrogenase
MTADISLLVRHSEPGSNRFQKPISSRTLLHTLQHACQSFEHASRALRKGKHVIIEKPVAQTPAQIRQLWQIADELDVRCLPGHNYIYAPEIQRGKTLIERGNLGTICGIWVHFAIFHPEELTRTWPGALRQVGTHFYYLLLYLLGMPSRLYALRSRLHYKEIKQEDQFMVQLEMKDGAPGITVLHVRVR